MNRYLPHSPLIPCFSPEFLMGGGRHNSLDNRLNSSNIYSYTEMMCLADETQISSAIFCAYRAIPPTSWAPPVHAHISAPAEPCICDSKIWKGEKAARGSRGSGG